MNRQAPRAELALLRMRAGHKDNELDEALRTDWGWRVPRLQLWAINMMISTCEEQMAA